MSLSFTALLLIAHGIVSDTSYRPVECLKHATILCPVSLSVLCIHCHAQAPFLFGSTMSFTPLPPPHLTTPLVPHDIVFDMTSNQNNVRASVSLSVR